jgi:membrane protease YdiL (CAAX protease family)
MEKGTQKTIRLIAWILLGAGALCTIFSFQNELLALLHLQPVSNFMAWPFLRIIGFGIIFLSITLFTCSSFFVKIPPWEDLKFWLKRVFFDTFLGVFFIPLVLSFIFIEIVVLVSLYFQTEIPTFDINNIESMKQMAPLLFFFFAGLTQLSLGAVILLRMVFKNLPKNLIKFSLLDLKAVLLAIPATILVLLISLLFIALLQALGIEVPPQFDFPADLKNQIWLILIPGVIGAPIFEELFFRGYILSILSKKNPWVGLIVSSILFGLVHFDLMLFLPLFLMGLILGIAYLRTQNLLTAILIHALNNLVALGLPFLLK